MSDKRSNLNFPKIDSDREGAKKSEIGHHKPPDDLEVPTERPSTDSDPQGGNKESD